MTIEEAFLPRLRKHENICGICVGTDRKKEGKTYSPAKYEMIQTCLNCSELKCNGYCDKIRKRA